jgi:hypothetical protein
MIMLSWAVGLQTPANSYTPSGTNYGLARIHGRLVPKLAAPWGVASDV